MRKLKQPLTKKQFMVYNKIFQFIVKEGYAPTLIEIAKFAGSNNHGTGQYFISQLIQKGYLKKRFYKHQAIKII